MKTPMDIYNTAMKKKKNRKGFSLVELIVVLVIMAILAAALVPTLVGYIKQTRQSNAKNECAAAVSAAQTIGSSAFANPDCVYSNNGDGGNLKFNFTATPVTVTSDASGKDVTDVIEYLSEVGNGTVSDVEYTSEGVITKLTYTKDGTVVKYDSTATSKYDIQK